DKDKDVPDKAASKPGPKKSAKPVPAPPVNPEEVLPHLIEKRKNAEKLRATLAEDISETDVFTEEPDSILRLKTDGGTRADLPSLPLDVMNEDADIEVVDDEETEVSEEAVAIEVPSPDTMPPDERAKKKRLVVYASIAGGAVLIVATIVLASWLIGANGGKGGHVGGSGAEESGQTGQASAGKAPVEASPPQPTEEAPPVETAPPPEPEIETGPEPEPQKKEDEPAREKGKKGVKKGKKEKKGGKKGNEEWELLFTPEKKKKKKKKDG
ncbi:MAG: hypothetical protein JRG91_14215, partial [Deltaproteobacteria bacterium]|nr:hypothetical protein [Deltaproteobacteria bacterium]